VPAAAAILVVQQPAKARERIPGGGQRLADSRGFDCELAAPVCVRGQQRRQPDLDVGYDATFKESTRAKLTGMRVQLSPSSALVKTSPPVVPT
jgi:hypothetical protein